MFEVVVLAFEGMSALHLSIPCAVFGETTQGLRLRVASLEMGPLRTTAGVGLIVDHGLEAAEQADLLIVPTWPDPEAPPPEALTRALTAAWERGACVMSLCLGAYPLAAAGLLDGREATTHWEAASHFSKKFPKVRLTPERLYVEEDRIWTSAGAAAGLDCGLAFLRRRFGGETANAAARRLVVAPHRSGGQAQFVARPTPQRPQDERLAQLLDALRAAPETPRGLDDLAARVGMSRRSFTRRFHAAMGQSPTRWLIAERVRRAQELLETTPLSVEDVAARAGFGSSAALRVHFAEQVGASPQRWRARFGQSQAAPTTIGRVAT
jgi:transcriptional regulator GlxA family with amidase domain